MTAFAISNAQEAGKGIQDLAAWDNRKVLGLLLTYFQRIQLHLHLLYQ